MYIMHILYCVCNMQCTTCTNAFDSSNEVVCLRKWMVISKCFIDITPIIRVTLHLTLIRCKSFPQKLIERDARVENIPVYF